MKYKNYCICKRKKGVLHIDSDCFAKYIHNGKKTVEIDNLEAFYQENREVKINQIA